MSKVARRIRVRRSDWGAGVKRFSRKAAAINESMVALGFATGFWKDHHLERPVAEVAAEGQPAPPSIQVLRSSISDPDSLPPGGMASLESPC